jgi:hypothetical protein
MAKTWDKMTTDEKAEWLRAEIRQLSSLYAMLASQIQEIGRSVKAIGKKAAEKAAEKRAADKAAEKQ